MTGIQVLGMVVVIAGMAILVINGGWWIGLGVFLMITGNNMERHRRGQ
jgi:hypothetical protein